MTRRPILYELVAGDVMAVKNRVSQLLGDGWWLHGKLISLNDTQVARELVKFGPIRHVPDGGGVVTVMED